MQDERRLVGLSGVYGFLAVAFGAFGAHGLRGILSDVEDAAVRLDWWETAARYHLVHALAILGCAWLASRGPGRAARVGGVAFALGALVFSGTLYAMALGAPRWLGAVTPLGGVALLVGWACVVGAAVRP
jgi:uncharacterized membrane protein YgdD (TMEM256/DUF423 family)